MRAVIYACCHITDTWYEDMVALVDTLENSYFVELLFAGFVGCIRCNA